MQNLFLTREQAQSLGSQLVEYVRMEDASKREVFESFEVRYGDNLQAAPDDTGTIEIHPKANFGAVSGHG